jgi:hypothetical protein
MNMEINNNFIQVSDHEFVNIKHIVGVVFKPTKIMTNGIIKPGTIQISVGYDDDNLLFVSEKDKYYQKIWKLFYL